MKLKELLFGDAAEIQETVTDELKKVQKMNFRQLCRNCMPAQKPICIYMLLLFWEKMYVSSSSAFDLKKKICPKTFGRNVYVPNA